GLTDILSAIFPCSSIAGEPKAEAMILIQQLEEEERNVYCGTIGYMTPQKQAVFNVPIRTVLIDHDKRKSSYGVGGALTEGSTAKEEYAEIKAKANVLKTKFPHFDLLETIGLLDGHYIVLDKHFKRLKKSAHYFNITLKLTDIKQALLDIK